MIELLALTALLGLAVWRLASLLHTEDAFERVRVALDIEHDEHGFPVVYPDTLGGKVFGCFWCLTLIAAVIVAPIVGWLNGYAGWEVVLVALASSAVAIWLEKQVMRSQAR